MTTKQWVVGGLSLTVVLITIIGGVAAAVTFFAKESVEKERFTEVKSMIKDSKTLIADSLKAVNENIKDTNQRITVDRLKDDRRHVKGQMRDMEKTYGTAEARDKQEYKCLQEDLEEIDNELSTVGK